MGGGPANCGLGLPAPFGACAPHATAVGAGCGSTVPVCVPGLPCGEGLALGLPLGLTVGDGPACVESPPLMSNNPAVTSTTTPTTPPTS